MYQYMLTYLSHGPFTTNNCVAIRMSRSCAVSCLHSLNLLVIGLSLRCSRDQMQCMYPCYDSYDVLAQLFGSGGSRVASESLAVTRYISFISYIHHIVLKLLIARIRVLISRPRQCLHAQMQCIFFLNKPLSLFSYSSAVEVLDPPQLRHMSFYFIYQ